MDSFREDNRTLHDLAERTMAAVLTDPRIATLIEEPKPLVPDFRAKVQPRPRRGHKERELAVGGSRGSEFRLILRESSLNPLDFSVILAYLLPQTNVLFRLRRYNGKSHEHTNKLEGGRFYDFHIHQATERYQETGFREDAFAEPTSRYQDFSGALQCMLSDCGFILPHGDQTSLL